MLASREQIDSCRETNTFWAKRRRKRRDRMCRALSLSGVPVLLAGDAGCVEPELRGRLAGCGWRRQGRCLPGSETHFPCDFCHPKHEEGWGFRCCRCFSSSTNLCPRSLNILAPVESGIRGGNCPESFKTADISRPLWVVKDPAPPHLHWAVFWSFPLKLL